MDPLDDLIFDFPVFREVEPLGQRLFRKKGAYFSEKLGIGDEFMQGGISLHAEVAKTGKGKEEGIGESLSFPLGSPLLCVGNVDAK